MSVIKMAGSPGRAYLSELEFAEPVPILVERAQRLGRPPKTEAIECSSVADLIDVCARVERGEFGVGHGASPELQFLVALAIKTGFARRRKTKPTRRG